MAESLTLTSPANKSQTKWDINYLTLNWQEAIITVKLTGNNGEIFFHSYTGSTATTMMIQLNKANLTSNSLQKRIFTQLINDGLIAGSVTGSPD